MLRHCRRREQQRPARQQSISLPFGRLSAHEKRGDDIFGHGDGTNPMVIQKVQHECLHGNLKLDENVFCLDSRLKSTKEQILRISSPRHLEECNGIVGAVLTI